MLRLPLLALIALWALHFAPVARAAPFVPASDAQVLERLPASAGDARSRRLRDLRQQLSGSPRDAALAVRLARAYYDEVAAEGDPRYIGYAQAALAPWWDLPAPPARVRVMRAVLRQFGHEFDAAVADLSAVVAEDPSNGEAWAWLAAVAMVQARYGDAKTACERTAAQASGLIVTACVAAVDSLTGRAAQAAAALQAAVASSPAATATERLWALTRLAEIEARRANHGSAEAAYRSALALGIEDGYLLASYADFLLDRSRPAEVLALLKGKERSDLLLLRLAVAAAATGDPSLAQRSAALTARFDAARLRGDLAHQKEEARFALSVLNDATRALPLAKQNYAVQREPSDARLLLEAALAARQPAAAQPGLDWMARSGVESAVLRSLAARLQGTP